MVFFHKNWRQRRSVLYMPSTNRRVLEKAPSLDCDGLVFDLEDSIADEARADAHRNLSELVKDTDFGDKERIIRLPQLGSPSFADDLAVSLSCKTDALLLPKVGSASDIEEFQQMLDGAPAELQLWAMIETPQALMNLNEIAACGENTRLNCLVIGPNDLAKGTGAKMEPGREVMLPWLMQILAAARAYNLCVLDGVYNNFRDLKGLDAECRQGASMGYDGKTLIHPAQIEAANLRFGPSKAEIKQAEAIIAAFDDPANSGNAVLQIDGEMFEFLHLGMARQLISSLKD
ncbi:MAG: CoA ester lyase [Rhizobiaceae bacterium]|nr:CoA ester lyase [Rhizobiaceae bacterium]